MVNRSGRYHARLVVPKHLRQIIGRTELRTPLGGDYREALKALPGAVAILQRQITDAERATSGAAVSAGDDVGRIRFPMSFQEMAYSHYMDRLALDDRLRDDPRWAMIGIDDRYVANLKHAIAGRGTDQEFAAIAGHWIDRFRSSGNHDLQPGTSEWRALARALCSAEYEALERVFERDEGRLDGVPSTPLIRDAVPADPPSEPVLISDLWDAYVNSRVQAGFMRDKGARNRPVLQSLRKFLRHNDARRVTKKDLIAWRDVLVKDLSPKTVNDVYLSAVRAVFAWAFENDRLPENVATSVRQPKPKATYSRERGYTDTEAAALLKASRSYQSPSDDFGRIRESAKMANMKRWVPIICAFTGARVSEITQLRKDDFRKEGDTLVMRITPDAGTVKAGGYRDVPMHRQLIDEGFEEFLGVSEKGPLFHNANSDERLARAAVIVSNKLSDWLRLSGLTPEGLQPNHAWRHRFKTQCRELGISDRVVDAIQGHAGRTAGDAYGDVTLKAKIGAIDKLPDYDLM